MDEFEEFVAARAPRLLVTAGLLTQDRQLAEDLLQTVLVKVWAAWDDIHTSPEAYARRALVHTYTSWWRRRWNGERPTETLPEHPASGPDNEAVLDLRFALARLPRRQRTVLVLRYFEDLPEREVAALMGCSVGTVKSQASKALAKLGVDPALSRHDHASEEMAR
ncbi:MAG: SigE family RNA polymerase sigma factor [Marmoricola sp.]